MLETNMDADKIINNLYENTLDNRPTFSEAILEHMKQEVDRIKEEAIKWHQEHKNA